jgi:hypothetical protein
VWGECGEVAGGRDPSSLGARTPLGARRQTLCRPRKRDPGRPQARPPHDGHEAFRAQVHVGREGAIGSAIGPQSVVRRRHTTEHPLPPPLYRSSPQPRTPRIPPTHTHTLALTAVAIDVVDVDVADLVVRVVDGELAAGGRVGRVGAVLGAGLLEGLVRDAGDEAVAAAGRGVQERDAQSVRVWGERNEGYWEAGQDRSARGERRDQVVVPPHHNTFTGKTHRK